MTSFLIDGAVVVDAGAITRALTIDEQRKIRHILISHTHMDHTATLPFLIENIFGTHPEPVSIYCAKQVLGAVRRHLFNNDTWPDFTRIPDHVEPSVRFEEVVAGDTFVIDGLAGGALEITAIPVNHIVPTTAFLIRQGESSIIFTSDTGPTDLVWQVANETEDLRALITECSFPNRLQAVADVSLHLTPKTLAGELAKLNRPVQILIYHFKPPYVDELRKELAEADLPWPLEELVQDRTYRF
jgi:ribonuclease BN (tRNA processing enzyme)